MSHNITVEGGSSVRLPTSGKYCDQDIIVTATGGEVVLPQLNAPTLSLDGDTLTITANADNGAFATSYDLYADGSLVGNYTSTTIDLTTLGLAEGTYSITARAKGANFVDSADSVAVSYEVVPTYVNLLTSDGYYLVASDGTILMAKE